MSRENLSTEDAKANKVSLVLKKELWSLTLIVRNCFGLDDIGFDWLILVRFDNYQVRLANNGNNWVNIGRLVRKVVNKQVLIRKG